jgi:hypothetical protein
MVCKIEGFQVLVEFGKTFNDVYRRLIVAVTQLKHGSPFIRPVLVVIPIVTIRVTALVETGFLAEKF